MNRPRLDETGYVPAYLLGALGVALIGLGELLRRTTPAP